MVNVASKVAADRTSGACCSATQTHRRQNENHLQIPRSTLLVEACMGLPLRVVTRPRDPAHAEFVPSFYGTRNLLSRSIKTKTFVVSGLMCFSTRQEGRCRKK
jgi:hypothetical protein